MFIDGSKFREQFLKRVPQRTFLWNYFKIFPAVQEEKILKDLLQKSVLVATATKVFDGINFCQQFLKVKIPRNIPAKFSQNCPSCLGGGEENVYKIIDDGQRTQEHQNLPLNMLS